MIARELERLLAASGAAASKVATITGQLREAGRLPKAGRGPNAPNIDTLQAATVLAAVAGSSRANEAGGRIAKLDRLTLAGARDGISFLSRLTQLLNDPEQLENVREIRVARTISRAVIIHSDGREDEYLGQRVADLEERFRAVGELPSGLLKKVALLLRREGGPPRRRRRRQDA